MLGFEVLLHAAGIVKTSLTNRTLVRRLARMNSNVNSEISFEGKSFTTIWTNVILEVGMLTFYVRIQMSHLNKTLLTFFTRIRSRTSVYEHVSLVRAHKPEPFTANFAFVRFLSRMNPVMLLTSHFSEKHFATVGTSVRFVSMPSLVIFQRCTAFEEFETNITLVFFRFFFLLLLQSKIV